MRTKTLLATAILMAAGVAVTSAQVTSDNVVGYVKKSVPAGAFALCANPLDNGDNSLNTVLPDVPDDTVVFEFIGGNFVNYTARTLGGNRVWTGAGADTATLSVGEGFFIQNNSDADFDVIFVGEVLQGDLSNPFGAGFNLLGSQVPQAGAVSSDLGLPAAADDQIFSWSTDSQSYLIDTLRDLGGNLTWTGQSGGEPNVDVGAGFFYNAGAEGSWDRSFNVE